MMTHTFKKWPLLIALTCAATAQTAYSLPASIQTDVYVKQIESLLVEKRFVEAKNVFAKYDQLLSENVKIRKPIEYYFYLAEIALNTGNPAQALENIDIYLTRLGKKGKYYQQGLTIYAQAELNLDQQQKQQEQQTHLEKVLAQLNIDVADIPAGQFVMGCSLRDDQCDSDEKPAHPVEIKQGFKIMTHEVTFAQWDACVADGGCKHNPYDNGWGRGDRPVINVNWNDVKEFANWVSQKSGLKFRLPSEAEWEYAARAGSQTRYTWGNELSCDQALFGFWSNECGHSPNTNAIGKYPKNAWGLYDMHGNVLEWTQDCWDPEAYQQKEHALDGAPWQFGDCSRPVVRGGSWNNSSSILRASNRAGYENDYRYNYLGFRLVLENPNETQLSGL